MLTIFLLSLAQAAATPAPQANPTAPPKKEKLVCESEQTPGSRIAKRRVCYTQQEWAAHKAQLAKMMSQKQTTGYFQEKSGMCGRQGC